MKTYLVQLLKSSAKFVAPTLLAVTTGIFCSSALLQAASPTAQSRFHIQNQWVLGGDGGWGELFFDSSSHQLYIPRTNRVMVVDAGTGKISGEVDGLSNARDIAFDGAGKFGYVTDLTDGTAGFVRVFDRASDKLVASIPTGINPDVIVFEPNTKALFAFNTRSHSATVIDSSTNQVVATISLPGTPTSAVVDGSGTLFVSIPALGEIVRVNAASKKIVGTLSLAPCTGPTGLAINIAEHQMFTTCEDHKLVSINTNSGHLNFISQVEAGGGDINFDANHKLLFVTDTSGTLSIFHRDSFTKYSSLQQVKTQPGARTMIVDHQNATAYLVTSKFGQRQGVSEELQFRPTPVQGTFSIIAIGR